MRYKVAISVALAVLAGCATVSHMEATGGSRSDGIVKLSFEAGMFDKVAIDEAAALETARRRCAVWGYTDADPFGGITRQCNAMSSYGCTRWFITREYQCTAGGSAPVAQASMAVQPIAGGAYAPSAAAPRKVRANTRSGYCLDVPPGYRGTGAENSPAVTSAMPRCSTLSPGK
jgi:hypothetical protein